MRRKGGKSHDLYSDYVPNAIAAAPLEKEKKTHRFRNTVGVLALLGIAGCSIYIADEYGEELKALLNAADDIRHPKDLPPESPEYHTQGGNTLTVCILEKPNCLPGDTETLATFTSGGNQIPVPIDRIAQPIIDATLAIEDGDYLIRDSSISLDGVLRATGRNLLAGEINEGAATIWQQVFQNLYPKSYPHDIHGDLTEAQKIENKGHEMSGAQTLFNSYGDTEEGRKYILERYLNIVNFGSGTYGIETAMRTYFGHGSDQATYWEAAFIMSLPRGPSLYEGSAENPQRNLEQRSRWMARASRALKSLYEAGKITPEEYTAWAAPEMEEILKTRMPTQAEFDALAHKFPPTLKPYNVYQQGPTADYHIADFNWSRHAVQMALDEMVAQGHTIDSLLSQGDFSLNMSLSGPAQNTLAATINSVISNPNYPQDGRRVTGVLLHPDGQIAAMVGNNGNFTENQANLTLAPRLVGSEHKIIFWAWLLQSGHLANLDESVINFDLAKWVWSGGNSDGTDYQGTDPGSMRCAEDGICNGYEAIESSSPLIMEIMEQYGLAGIAEVRAMMDQLGLTSGAPTVPSNILGSAETSPLQNASGAHAINQNGGAYVAPGTLTISLVNRETGEAIYTKVPSQPGQAVLSEEVIRQINAAMRLVAKGQRGTARRQLGGYQGDILLKTGTAHKNFTANVLGTVCVQAGPFSFAIQEAYPDGNGPDRDGDGEPDGLGNDHDGGYIPAQVIRGVGEAMGPREDCGLR